MAVWLAYLVSFSLEHENKGLLLIDAVIQQIKSAFEFHQQDLEHVILPSLLLGGRLTPVVLMVRLVGRLEVERDTRQLVLLGLHRAKEVLIVGALLAEVLLHE